MTHPIVSDAIESAWVQEEKTQHWAQLCSHQSEQLRRFHNIDWATQTRKLDQIGSLRRQCIHCGKNLGIVRTVEFRRTGKDPWFLPEYDYDLWSDIAREIHLGQVAYPPNGAPLQAVEEQPGGNFYTSYMASAAWRAKRDLVMDRARGTCEGCGRAQPTQVHHLNYRRLGREMLFDLVAVCRHCHEAIHGVNQR